MALFRLCHGFPPTPNIAIPSIPLADVYGHTTLKTPVLVRSPKLSSVGSFSTWMGDRLGIPSVVDTHFCRNYAGDAPIPRADTSIFLVMENYGRLDHSAVFRPHGRYGSP